MSDQPNLSRPEKSCYKCRHWKQAKPYAWGNCTAPLPVWAFNLMDAVEAPIAEDDEGQAEDCDLYDLPAIEEYRLRK